MHVFQCVIKVLYPLSICQLALEWNGSKQNGRRPEASVADKPQQKSVWTQKNNSLAIIFFKKKCAFFIWLQKSDLHPRSQGGARTKEFD